MKVFRPYVESLQGRWSELFYYVIPVNEEAISHVGKFGERLVDGRMENTVESTKFPIGWRKSHYNRPPSDYHIKTDWLLSNEDKQTKTMLQFLEAQIPWENPKHQGIPVKRLCHASTKAEVLRVLDTMAPNKDLALLKSMMKKKANLGGSESQNTGTPPLDLQNIKVAVPITEVSPTDAVARSSEEPLEKKQAARGSPTETNVVPAPQKRKQTESGAPSADAQKIAKKSKSSRSSKHRSGPVSVDADFFQKNLEEYKVDPIGAAGNLFKHLAEVKSYEMAEIKKKTQDELQRVEDKLQHTANLLKTKGALLDQAHSDLNRATAARDEYKAQAEEAQLKVEDMKATISELEASNKELEDQLSVLKEQLMKLEADLHKAKLAEENISKTAAEARIAELERRLEKSEAQKSQAEAEKDQAVDLASRVADGGFLNAVEQIQLVYPDLKINHDWIRSDCEVEDGKIIQEDLETGEKTVIYPEN